MKSNARSNYPSHSRAASGSGQSAGAMRRIAGRLRAANLMSAVAVFLAVGGGAFALASPGRIVIRKITVCVHKKGGGLYKAHPWRSRRLEAVLERRAVAGIHGAAGAGGCTGEERHHDRRPG